LSLSAGGHEPSRVKPGTQERLVIVVMNRGTQAACKEATRRAGATAEEGGLTKQTGIPPGRESPAQPRASDLSLGTIDSRISVEHVDIDLLRSSEHHPRAMPEDEMLALERSIDHFGLVDPIVARREDRTIIGGHQRWVAAQHLGLTQVPVVFLDISEDRAQLLGLALNRIQGGWDEPKLAALLKELDSLPDLDVCLSGFGRDEIDELLARIEAVDLVDRDEQFDLDEALEQAEKECRPQRGDLWLLGRHRLLCGDATTSDVQRLLAGEAAHMVFTDPPYNIAYDPSASPSGRRAGPPRQRQGSRHGNGRRRQPLGPMENDDLPPEQYQEFLVRSFQNLAAALPGGGPVYICGATSAIPAYFHAFAAADLHFSSMIIWNKGSFALSRKDYHPQFELIWYGWCQGKPHYFGGGRSQSDVWEIHREDGRSYLHPTQKPVELVQRAIQNSARPGQTVLDAFLGSGTTVIASEKSGRRCLGLEIDPLFCEVALARWERFTGERARRAD